jgi:hypothetical protein
MAGASDRLFVFLTVGYKTQIWVYRVAIFTVPFLAAYIAYRVCLELTAGERVEHDMELAEEEARAERAHV